MAVTTSVQPRYAFKQIAMIVICLLLGLWGIYDYVIKIPRNARIYERWQVYSTAKASIETMRSETATQAEREEAVKSAAAAIDAAGEKVLKSVPSGDVVIDLGTFEPMNDTQFAGELGLIGNTIQQVAQLRPTEPMNDELQTGFEFLKARLNATDGIEPPSKFDHMMQWMFILCLPFVPLAGWLLLKAKSQRFSIDDDGNFTHPGGTWAADDVADIDMSRWMSKSIAEVKNTAGDSVKIDDFVHRGGDLIAGHFASRFHPDDWTIEGKQKKKTDASKTPEGQPLVAHDADTNAESPADDNTPDETSAKSSPERGA